MIAVTTGALVTGLIGIVIGIALLAIGVRWLLRSGPTQPSLRTRAWLLCTVGFLLVVVGAIQLS